MRAHVTRPLFRRMASTTLAAFVFGALGGLITGCSATEAPHDAGSTEGTVKPVKSTNIRGIAAPPASGVVLASAAQGPPVADGLTSTPTTCPPGKAPSQAQALRTIDQRCLKLRQDGEVWQRTRKLAVINRGESGGRMADLHSPWTKDNMTFYVDHCSPSQQKTREQALNRMDPRQLASTCG